MDLKEKKKQQAMSSLLKKEKKSKLNENLLIERSVCYISKQGETDSSNLGKAKEIYNLTYVGSKLEYYQLIS